MPLRIVQSKQNPRLKQLRRALARPLRDPAPDGRMLAGIEGPNLLEEALRARLHIDCVFVAEGSQHLLDALEQDGLKIEAKTEVLLLPRDLLTSALSTEAPQPIAALVEPPDWTLAHLLNNKSASLLIVLAGLQDPGNLGTILRSAEAFGADGMISLPGTVSAWNTKAVRASAGSLFRLPLLCLDEEACFLHLREAGVSVVSTTVHGAQPADLFDLSRPVALIIGNEGNGVSFDIAAHAEAAITIPCSGPVESLNAAVAASVLLYEASRQRSATAISSRTLDRIAP
jgi:TrmH family RNA methyltransferase